ncbi:hypothetical protein CYMTET_31733 [Cymbomonas tetramitiformis]|uniref:G domain-containing protein n=1 Tax=Cymbomonas tetramitiformis TaxID=36881 RepID=A0AAE0KSN7_9CHLO|nr:hypothetical protein CYMTET_31733 [Cymbomonas tetramitiformis]
MMALDIAPQFLTDTNKDAPGFYIPPKLPRSREEVLVEDDEVLSEPVHEESSREEPEPEYVVVKGGPTLTDAEQRMLEALQDEDPDVDEDDIREFEDDEDAHWTVPKRSLEEEPLEKVVVCDRCHKLRNYGRIEKQHVEALLPSFDFEQVVGERLGELTARPEVRLTALVVVDIADFDGSFPRSAVQVLDDAYGKLNTVLVLTKSDLLPSAATKARLLEWSRRRARAGGIFEPIGVHLVSSHTGWGVQKLLSQLERELCGGRGLGHGGAAINLLDGALKANDVCEALWAGARSLLLDENAGKSSLINAMSGYRGGTKSNKLLARAPVTASTMPGTTIGVVEVKNVLPAPHRMLDTPGLLHPHQLTPRLSPEEVKCVLPRRALKPRTYRLSKGAAIHIGGLARVDVEDCPGSTMLVPPAPPS